MRGKRSEAAFLDALFGRRPRSLYIALEQGLVPPEYLAEAKRILASYVRKPTRALPARSLYNDPGWDNVIRALEEDR